MMTAPWFSPEWFFPSSFASYQWEHPGFLYALPIVPLIFVARALWRKYFGQKVAVALIKSDLQPSRNAWLRFVPEVLICLVVGLMLVALARPQRSNEKAEQWTEGIDIMIALDVSQSMEIEDFTPNRLAAAKKSRTRFHSRPDARPDRSGNFFRRCL